LTSLASVGTFLFLVLAPASVCVAFALLGLGQKATSGVGAGLTAVVALVGVFLAWGSSDSGWVLAMGSGLVVAVVAGLLSLLAAVICATHRAGAGR
jgi:hypothetical protein